MAPPNALSCALFLVLAFSIAGLIQARWLGSQWSRRFDWPLDAGLRIRRRRLLGANKTARGFVAMVPASALAFPLVAAVMTAPPWPLSAAQYFALGAAAGFGFMAGELPNSFIKRQFDIPPGQAPSNAVGRVVSALIDRLDSVVGMALLLAWLVPVPVLTWLVVIVIGPVLHGLFSVLVFRWGGKARAA
jgi:hypothetical protein